MDLEKVYVADIETKGLIKDIHSFDDFHILGVGFKTGGKWGVKTTTSKEDVQKFFGNKDNVIIMHYGLLYDKPVLEKMGIEVNATIVDSLALSWNLFPTRNSFGLEAFGEEYKIPKPAISDWENLTLEDYKHRVEEDVKINILLWEEILKKGRQLYDSNLDDFIRLIHMLNFIMTCAHKQEVQGLHVDIPKTESNLAYFEKLKEEKVEALKNAMPKKEETRMASRPAKPYKKDGTLSVTGKKWFDMLDKMGLERSYKGEVEVLIKLSEPNPNSTKQKKDWLYSLGWVPETYSYIRDKTTNDTRKVEQILTPDKSICPSVLKLAKEEPAILEFEDLSIISHRIGILKGFLTNCDENGMICQRLRRLAVTLRWQHSIIVNLPKVTGKGDLRDGTWVRDCLIPPPGYRIVQSDLSGIESRTSDHYTFHINPERIKKTKLPFFDPHTEVAVVSGLMTKAEETYFVYKRNVKDFPDLDVHNFSELYPYSDTVEKMLSLSEEEQSKLIFKLSALRHSGKTTNYSSLYLVGATTLGRTLDISKGEAQKLIDSYWNIHFAVKDFTETLQVKVVDGEEWMFNPMSKFFYHLRNTKDKFSVCNQGSAVYCFNMWIYFVSKRGHFPVIQNHDDLALISPDNEEDINRHIQVLNDAMEDLNNYLKLNVRIDHDPQSGKNLSETH